MRFFVATAIVIAMCVGWWFYSLVPLFIVLANTFILCFWSVFPQRYQYLTSLGMIGTLVGLSLAFSTIDISALSDVDAVKEMIGSTIRGIGIAISTTLTGVVFWMVEDWNHGES